jgi:hypothetical protein
MPARQGALKQRTTLTLPADSLQQAKRIAHSRRVHLSTVISEVVSIGLQVEADKQRRKEILDNYRKAFSGFTEDELALLDGVILEPVSAGKRK